MIITFTNQKGGDGKTTSAVAGAHGLARMGWRVILADLDQQGNAAICLGLDPEQGVYDYLIKELDPASLLGETDRPNLQLLAGNGKTKSAQITLQSQESGRADVIAALRRLADMCDVLVLDTAADGIFQESAIAASDVVVIPTKLEALSVDAVTVTLKLIARLNPSALVRILPTGLNRREAEHSRNLFDLRRAYGCVAPPIPKCAEIPKGVPFGWTVWECAKSGQLKKAQDAYQALLDDILEVQHGR